MIDEKVINPCESIPKGVQTQRRRVFWKQNPLTARPKRDGGRWGFLGDIEFFESRVPYTVDVMLTMDLTQPVNIEFEQRPDFYSDLNPTTPSDDYDNSMDGMLTFTRQAYDQATVVSLIKPKDMGTDAGDSAGFFSSLGGLIADHPLAVIFSLLMLLGAAGTAGYAVRLQTKEDVEDAIIMAELEEKD